MSSVKAPAVEITVATSPLEMLPLRCLNLKRHLHRDVTGMPIRSERTLPRRCGTAKYLLPPSVKWEEKTCYDIVSQHVFWCARLDSNQRPSGSEPNALSTWATDANIDAFSGMRGAGDIFSPALQANALPSCGGQEPSCEGPPELRTQIQMPFRACGAGMPVLLFLVKEENKKWMPAFGHPLS